MLSLIADGAAADRLGPTANIRTLAKVIPRAILRLYPDAGHAFLFQERSFPSLVGSFLGLRRAVAAPLRDPCFT